MNMKQKKIKIETKIESNYNIHKNPHIHCVFVF